MKELYIIICMVFIAIPAAAQNILTIYQKDGRFFSYGFDDKPVIKYTDNDLILKSHDVEVYYPLSAIAKIAFTESTAIETIEEIYNNPTILLENHLVRINGSKPGIIVAIVGIDGKTYGTYKTDQEGTTSFSISMLPKGIYIITSEEITCKFLKE